mmetsp:Transcript_12100/g.35325  ORF Transcript_12100/g.35325 Transcript_12100/m.35325 type:complete len:92 (+) Transcript_12100:42-317(+)
MHCQVINRKMMYQVMDPQMHQYLFLNIDDVTSLFASFQEKFVRYRTSVMNFQNMSCMIYLILRVRRLFAQQQQTYDLIRHSDALCATSPLK